MDLIKAALHRKRDALCAADQSVNALDTWAAPFLEPAGGGAAETVKAAWLPVRLGQPIAMLGEEVVGYAEPCEPV